MAHCNEVQLKAFDTNCGPIIWQNIKRKAVGSRVSRAVVALEEFTCSSKFFPGEVTTANPSTHSSITLKKHFAALLSSSSRFKFEAVVF